VRILTVCTHNRTRSVLFEALLGRHLHECGVDAQLASAGTGVPGFPPMPEVVEFLATLGIDASHHESHRVDASAVSDADLVLTAEVQHVVHVAGTWPGTFGRTFTLPEFVGRAEAVGPRAGRPVALWVAEIAADRKGGVDYLHDRSVPEVDDPTGGPPAAWSSSFVSIDGWCRRAAELLA
jgi:protein-tyrosine-phosphatase